MYAPPHPLASSMHHSRPTYIPSHVDPYSPYLPPPHAPAVLPQAPIVIAPASAAAAISQKNPLISSKSDGHDRLTQSQSRDDHQPSAANYKESKSSNQISANGKSNGFKVPSGKEGSLKHRILTRPYGEKDGAGKQKSTTNVTNSIATCPTSMVKYVLSQFIQSQIPIYKKCPKLDSNVYDCVVFVGPRGTTIITEMPAVILVRISPVDR